MQPLGYLELPHLRVCVCVCVCVGYVLYCVIIDTVLCLLLCCVVCLCVLRDSRTEQPWGALSCALHALILCLCVCVCVCVLCVLCVCQWKHGGDVYVC
jgi:hypothetical protein